MSSEDQPKTRRERFAAERTRQRAAEEAARRAAAEQPGDARTDVPPVAPAEAAAATEQAATTPSLPRQEPAVPQQPVSQQSQQQQPPTAEQPAPQQAVSTASSGQTTAAATPRNATQSASAAASTDADGDTLLTDSPDPFAKIFGTDDDPDASHIGKPVRQRRKRKSPRIGTIAVVLVALLVIGGGAVAGWSFFGDRIQQMLSGGPEDYEGTGNGTPAQFSIIAGDTGTDIAIRLAEADIIKSSEAFIDAVLARPEQPDFHPGTYQLQQQMSASSALVALLDPNNVLANTVMIPEGTIMKDIFTSIETSLEIPLADIEAAAADPASYGLPAEATNLEGFLFPATYTFEPGVDARTVLQTMVNRMFQAFDEHGIAEEDRWETVLLASVVQREASMRVDFPKVARVFLNRLTIDMPLQSDATITYGTGNTHIITTTDAERADASNPYNSYVHHGLPPTPISNPGDMALEGTVHPADGEWLYFVTVNLDSGETVFSNTYEEHLVAVDQYLAWLEDHPEYLG